MDFLSHRLHIGSFLFVGMFLFEFLDLHGEASSERARATEQQCQVKAEKDTMECRLTLGVFSFLHSFPIWRSPKVAFVYKTASLRS